MLNGVCLVLLVGLANYATGQNEPEIKYLHVKSDIRVRFATTEITSVMANNLEVARDVIFNVYLPDQAFISNFSMIIDGVEYAGDVKEKEAAKKAYETAKRRGQSAGHVAQKPREANKFKIDINVAAHKEVKFSLMYQELLKRKFYIYEHAVYVNPAGPVNDIKIEVFIAESREINYLGVPPLRPIGPTVIFNEAGLNNQYAKVSRPSIKTAHIIYKPPNNTVEGIFVITYDIDRRRKPNGDIMAVNGYFVHFFVPIDLKPIPKDVLFIIDTSGSMYGRKMTQVKSAMDQIVQGMIEGDRFNIMDFDSSVKFWKQDMMLWNEKNEKDALAWIKTRPSSGSTNINTALLKGLDLLQDFHLSKKEGRLPLIIFLTDGAASSGVTNGLQIQKNVAEKNTDEIPLFSLSFGADADFPLLQKISLQNHAVARRIYEASDTVVQLKNFYKEISAALMTNLKFEYFGDTVENTSLTTSEFHRYFKGTESVIAGRLTNDSISTLRWNLVGSTNTGSVDHSDTSEVFDPSEVGEGIGLLKDEDIKGIPEKLWAYLTIKQLLEKRIITNSETEKEELKQQAVKLSLKYQFVTPVTSMEVVKPESEEAFDAEESQTVTTSGDPYFLVYVKNLTYPICFDVPALQCDKMTLISDPENGLEVTTEMIAGKDQYRTGGIKTFMGTIFIQSRFANVIVTPQYVFFNGQKFSWSNETRAISNISNLEITGDGHNLMIKVSNSQHFLIKRSLAGHRPTKVDYLNFYVVIGKGFSKNVKGYIGKFMHLKAKLRHTKKNAKGQTIGKLRFVSPDRRFYIEHAILNFRNNTIRSEIPCWVLHHSAITENGRKLGLKV